MAAAGIYDLRIHHDQVLRPVLLGHWRLHELGGLDDDHRIRDVARERRVHRLMHHGPGKQRPAAT